MSASNLEKVLNRRQFCGHVGVRPSEGGGRGTRRKKGGYLKGYVDAVNVTDNQTSVVRMSSIGAQSS